MMKRKKTNLQELYADLEDKRNKYLDARKAYDKAYKESNQINFLGKYIKVEEDEPTYLFVKEQLLLKGEWSSPNPVERFVLRGFGFRYVNTPYIDASYFNWDWMYEYTFYNDRTRELTISKIKEITEDEFKSALYKGFQETQQHVEEIFASKYFQKKDEE